MYVELLHITPDAENFIGQAASICYDAKTDRDSNIRRAKQVAEKGHLACLRFAHATFKISGISRVCSHQLVRHKFLDFLQRSQRYCKETAAGFVEPLLTDEQFQLYYESVLSSQCTYDELIRMGVKKEDARFVLPEATHTELNVVGNLQAWKDFINLRADPHAQAEIREVAKQINNELHKHCPNLFTWMP